MVDNIFGPYSNIIKRSIIFYHNSIYTTSAVSQNLVPVILPSFNDFLGNNLSEIPSGYDEFTFNTNGIDYTECCRSKRLVYIGRLSPEKSVDRLLSFFKQLYEMDSEYTLDIVGDGPSRASLEASNQLQSVSFRGNQPHNIACTYYKRAQAFVTFSTTEAFGFTCLEALACGTHCLYPKCDVFDKLYSSAFPDTRFDSDNFDTFKRAVDYTYGNDKHIENNQFTLNRTWKKATEELVNIYSDVIIKK
jgi:glycosyltransferase involved in cell wall biosynthesis